MIETVHLANFFSCFCNLSNGEETFYDNGFETANKQTEIVCAITVSVESKHPHLAVPPPLLQTWQQWHNFVV